jgi:RWD domain
VSYTENYPDDAPILDLSVPPSTQKYPYLDISTDKTHLLTSLTPTVTENLGMQMIFTLVSTLKENTETLIADRQAAVRAVQEAQLLKQEEEENRKFHGTPVTRETFLEWRKGFRREMEEEEARRKAEAEADEKRKKQGQAAREERKAMTGRELWENGLVGKVDEEEEGDEADSSTLESEVSKLTVAT